MSEIKHILFPVDFSDGCNSAAPFVAEMARRYSAKVTLLAVEPPSFSRGLESAPLIDPEIIRNGLKTQLEGAFRNEFSGMELNRVTVLGDPAEAITDFVAAKKVDLVMMPTHGYGPFRQLLLGSVAAKVLHDVHVPVWTAAHTSVMPDRKHLVPRHILCAVDSSSASIELMRTAGGFAKNFGATLRLVHAVPAIEAWPELSMDEGFEETVREKARRTIENLKRAAGIQAPVCIGAGAVPDVIREAALQHEIDLFIIGRGGLDETLGRLRTHSYGIIRNAPCPVLSL